jgi:hypothetical protein
LRSPVPSKWFRDVEETVTQSLEQDEALSDAGLRAGAAAAGEPAWATRAAFGAATFLGAFLLFLVQPVAAKYLLPWFGGGPAVWTACMLFFQGVLLAGYAYAHLGVVRWSPRAQTVTHLVLLALSVVVALGLVSTSILTWQPRAEASASELAPLGRILLLLTLTVALPCFVLSATSPLLNAWYARAAPGAGSRVYRLYAISNAGSLLALVAYPFVIEPAMTRHTQVGVWAGGVVLFAGACAACAVRAVRAARAGSGGGRERAGDVSAEGLEHSRQSSHPTAHPETLTPARSRAVAGSARFSRSTGRGSEGATGIGVGLLTRVLWFALPACSSVILLAVTNTMTHDVAAMPLLWVLPLVLYLLTFILAFDARRWYRRGVVAGVLLPLAAAAVCAVLLGIDTWLSIGGRVALLAAAMFVCCFVCHGELAAMKPPARGLTAFYLSIAAGGAIGAVLVAVVAPLVLDRYVELHGGLWACGLLALAAPLGRGARVNPAGMMAGVVGLVVLGAVLWEARDPYPLAGGRAVGRWRDFYGVVTLYRANEGDAGRECLLFRHAGVTHGLQFVDPVKRRTPTTYFSPDSGVGISLRVAQSQRNSLRVGVVGLGAGTLAAYGRGGDVFRFYELSPTVVRVAREKFTYLADSAADCRVVEGDGRLSLQRERPQGFDVLILDAFTGHAIPYHLLTAEAFALYRRHLAPGGVIAVNVTNSFVDIQPVVAQQAAAANLTALLFSQENPKKLDDSTGLLAADWVLLTDDADTLAAFRRLGGVAPRSDPSLKMWTDEYASLYPVLR